MPERNRYDIVAILVILGAYALYAAGDACVKLLAGKHDVFTVLFFNSLVVVILAGLYGFLRYGASFLKTERGRYHALKSVLGCVFSFLIVYALGHTTLAEFYLMVFTAPLWVVVFSVVMTKEKPDIFRSFIVLAGFGVIVYIFMLAGIQRVNLGLLSAAVCGFGIGFNMIFVRKFMRYERPVLIGFFNSLAILLAVAPFMLDHIQGLEIIDVPYFLGSGAGLLLGGILLTYAYQIAGHGALLAPFHYTQMLHGAVIGYAFFNEIPEGRTVTGLFLIATIGLGLLWHDYRQNRRLRRYDPDPALG